jgi:hypothetical protein
MYLSKVEPHAVVQQNGGSRADTLHCSRRGDDAQRPVVEPELWPILELGVVPTAVASEMLGELADADQDCENRHLTSTSPQPLDACHSILEPWVGRQRRHQGGTVIENNAAVSRIVSPSRTPLTVSRPRPFSATKALTRKSLCSASFVGKQKQG